MFGQLVLAGIVSGAIYALIAVGLVVTYKASNVLNFAHGYISAVAAFVSFTLLMDRGVAAVLAVPAAIAASAILALLTEALVVRPLRGERPLTIIVATLGVALIVSGLINLQWGPSPKLYPPLVRGDAFALFGLTVNAAQALMVAVAIVVIGTLAAFFRFSRTGLSMRAASESATIAALLGINLRLVSVASWGAGGALGGIAAVLVAPQISLTPDAFSSIMVQGFTAVVLAGFTNLIGAVIGGFITGIALNLFSGYVVSDLPNTFLLIVLLLVLLIRPHGLFGRQESVHL